MDVGRPLPPSSPISSRTSRRTNSPTSSRISRPVSSRINYNNQNNNQQNGYQQPPYQQNNYQQNGYQQNGYQQNGYQQNPYQPNGPQYGNYRVPVKNRNIALCIVLSIITCGIYWMYKAGEKVAYIKQRNTGEVDSSSSVLYLILGILNFGIVVYALIQSELNKVATLQ